MGWPRSRTEVKLTVSGSTELWLYAERVVSWAPAESRNEREEGEGEKKIIHPLTDECDPRCRDKSSIFHSTGSVWTSREIEITHFEDLFVPFTPRIKMYTSQLFLYFYINANTVTCSIQKTVRCSLLWKEIGLWYTSRKPEVVSVCKLLVVMSVDIESHSISVMTYRMLHAPVFSGYTVRGSACSDWLQGQRSRWNMDSGRRAAPGSIVHRCEMAQSCVCGRTTRHTDCLLFFYFLHCSPLPTRLLSSRLIQFEGTSVDREDVNHSTVHGCRPAP